jgi:hypothetical protein
MVAQSGGLALVETKSGQVGLHRRGCSVVLGEDGVDVRDKPGNEATTFVGSRSQVQLGNEGRESASSCLAPRHLACARAAGGLDESREGQRGGVAEATQLPGQRHSQMQLGNEGPTWERGASGTWERGSQHFHFARAVPTFATTTLRCLWRARRRRRRRRPE